MKQDKKDLEKESKIYFRRERETDKKRQARLVNTKLDQHKVKLDFFPDIDWLGAEKLNLQHLTHPRMCNNIFQS